MLREVTNDFVDEPTYQIISLRKKENEQAFSLPSILDGFITDDRYQQTVSFLFEKNHHFNNILFRTILGRFIFFITALVYPLLILYIFLYEGLLLVVNNVIVESIILAFIMLVPVYILIGLSIYSYVHTWRQIKEFLQSENSSFYNARGITLKPYGSITFQLEIERKIGVKSNQGLEQFNESLLKSSFIKKEQRKLTSNLPFILHGIVEKERFQKTISALNEIPDIVLARDMLYILLPAIIIGVSSSFTSFFLSPLVFSCLIMTEGFVFFIGIMVLVVKHTQQRKKVRMILDRENQEYYDSKNVIWKVRDFVEIKSPANHNFPRNDDDKEPLLPAYSNYPEV